jgi:hypothetical protein
MASHLRKTKRISDTANECPTPVTAHGRAKAVIPTDKKKRSKTAPALTIFRLDIAAFCVRGFY